MTGPEFPPAGPEFLPAPVVIVAPLAGIRKALIAALITAASTLLPLLVPVVQNSRYALLAPVIGALVALLATYSVKNAPVPPAV